MQYAGKIQISYTPLKKVYTRTIILPNRLLTLSDLSKHLNSDEKFTLQVSEKEEILLCIQGWKYETKGEMSERIKKEEAYNLRYENFHAENRK